MQKSNVRLLQQPNVAGVSTEHSSSSVQQSTGGLTPVLWHIYEEVQREVGYERIGDTSAEHLPEDVENTISRIATRLGFELTATERDEILAQFERNARPFGVLQQFVDDEAISDIIISDYATIAVKQGKTICSTGVQFPSQKAYESFVERLLQKAGSTYSTKKPVADGMIGSFARLHAVHRCLCDTGPYVTIRLNRFSSVMPKDLVEFGLAPVEVMDYLSRVAVSGQTVLIVGEVGAGKTTLARALASQIPGQQNILVIEDTPEIRLEHPHVRYIATREENADGAGRVAPSQCIRAGMRMAMDRIIFGEIRDAEAAEAFIDVCASGHPGMSTIHARSANEALTRLELFLGRAQRGVGASVLQKQIATAVQVLAFVDVCRETGKRRIVEVKEVGGSVDGNLSLREIFRYECKQGVPSWRLASRVSHFRQELEDSGGVYGSCIRLSELPPMIGLNDVLTYKEAVMYQR